MISNNVKQCSNLRIGDTWPGVDGIYAGISLGCDGQEQGHLVLLNEKPGKRLSWAYGVVWAQSLGSEAHLPTKSESALLYANLRDQFVFDDWYWTSTQYSKPRAFCHYFSDGYQLVNGKQYEGLCMAVRRFAI